MNTRIFKANTGQCIDQTVDSIPHQKLFENEPDVITVQRISEITGLCENVIRGQIRSGKLPGCKIGARYFIPKSSLIQYITGGGGLDTCPRQHTKDAHA